MMKLEFIRKYKNRLILLGSILLAMSSCKKFDFPVDNTTARAFHPSTLSANSNSITATTAILEWPMMPGTKVYALELSRDSLQFQNIVSTFQINSDSIPSSTDMIDLTIRNLFGNTTYSARIKTTSANGLADSKYITVTFKTKAEQILSAVGPTDKTATSVTIKWPAGSAVTHFMVTPAGGAAQKYDISADEMAAGKKTITGLTAATSYTFDIYNTDLNKRGSITVVTFSNPPTASRVVWLTAADTLGIQAVLDSCTASSLTIVLPNGKYVFKSATDIPLVIKSALQSVNFYAIPGTDTTKLKIKSITLPATLSMDAITFENLKVGGYDPTADYCFNPSTTTGSLTNISFKNCQIRDFRGVLRVRGSITVSNFSVTNCYVYNIKGYGLVTMDSNGTPLVDNIALNGCTFNGMDVFIQSVYRNISSLDIENCTFYDMVNSGKYLIDFKTTFTPATFNIANCIFSNMRYTTNSSTGVVTYGNGYEALNAPVISNSYKTSDFIMSKGAFNGLTDYVNSSTDLFTEPTKGNFSIKDLSFAGTSTAGDPRWRK